MTCRAWQVLPRQPHLAADAQASLPGQLGADDNLAGCRGCRSRNESERGEAGAGPAVTGERGSCRAGEHAAAGQAQRDRERYIGNRGLDSGHRSDAGGQRGRNAPVVRQRHRFLTAVRVDSELLAAGHHDGRGGQLVHRAGGTGAGADESRRDHDDQGGQGERDEAADERGGPAQ